MKTDLTDFNTLWNYCLNNENDRKIIIDYEYLGKLQSYIKDNHDEFMNFPSDYLCFLESWGDHRVDSYIETIRDEYDLRRRGVDLKHLYDMYCYMNEERVFRLSSVEIIKHLNIFFHWQILGENFIEEREQK